MKLNEKQIDEMLKHVDAESKKMTRFHLHHVRTSTGEVLLEDVEYCLNLNKRVKQHSMAMEKNTLPNFA